MMTLRQGRQAVFWWTIRNGVFLAVGVLGHILNNQILTNVFLGACLLAFCASVLAVVLAGFTRLKETLELADKYKYLTPAMDLTFDIFVLIFLAATAHWIVLVLYFLQTIFCQSAMRYVINKAENWNYYKE